MDDDIEYMKGEVGREDIRSSVITIELVYVYVYIVYIGERKTRSGWRGTYVLR